MNSCLADLSRLIPPQYMRKGRGRVEKTEIIEMAIKHLRNLQSQECVKRENTCAEHYRIGYQDCLSEAAKFLLNERGEDLCYRMVTRLKEHCNELMKGEYSKVRCSESVASSSPTHMHYEPPVSHLRDILTSASDIEHSSNDHIDVKDLSFRSSSNNNNNHVLGGGNQQTNKVTTSNSLAGALTNGKDVITAATAGADLHPNDTVTETELRAIRMRKYSEVSSADLEHNNNYKFKNYIKQRFSQDNHLDEKVGSSSASTCSSEKLDLSRKRRLSFRDDDDSDKVSHRNGSSHGGSTTTAADLKMEHAVNSTSSNSTIGSSTAAASAQHLHQNGRHPIQSFAVPIFACHTQGYYIPLNIDYDTLLPFLGSTDLLNKNFNQMPPLHPVSINVNYAPLKPNATFLRPKVEHVTNGW